MQTVGVGVANVIATCVVDPSLSASCTVTVQELNAVKLNGLITDAEGKTYWAEFSTDSPESWTAISDETTAYMGGALVGENLVVNNNSKAFSIDPETFETTQLSVTVNSTRMWNDATGAPAHESGAEAFANDRLIGLSNTGKNIVMLDPENGTISHTSYSSMFSNDPMAAIAFWTNTYDGPRPAQDCYVVTESGDLYVLHSWIVVSTGNMFSS